MESLYGRRGGMVRIYQGLNLVTDQSQIQLNFAAFTHPVVPDTQEGLAEADAVLTDYIEQLEAARAVIRDRKRNLT